MWAAKRTKVCALSSHAKRTKVASPLAYPPCVTSAYRVRPTDSGAAGRSCWPLSSCGCWPLLHGWPLLRQRTPCHVSVFTRPCCSFVTVHVTVHVTVDAVRPSRPRQARRSPTGKAGARQSGSRTSWAKAVCWRRSMHSRLASCPPLPSSLPLSFNPPLPLSPTLSPAPPRALFCALFWRVFSDDESKC